MIKRFDQGTLDAMLMLIKGEWVPEKGALGQSPQFYSMVAAYQEARDTYRVESLREKLYNKQEVLRDE